MINQRNWGICTKKNSWFVWDVRKRCIEIEGKVVWLCDDWMWRFVFISFRSCVERKRAPWSVYVCLSSFLSMCVCMYAFVSSRYLLFAMCICRSVHVHMSVCMYVDVWIACICVCQIHERNHTISAHYTFYSNTFVCDHMTLHRIHENIIRYLTGKERMNERDNKKTR